MNDLRTDLSWIAERCRQRFRSAVALSLAFKALNLAILAPLSAVILRYCLTRWGRASVGNFELVAFFASPAGIAALLGTGAVLLASYYLELSGLIRLLADGQLHWWQAFKSSTRLLLRLVELGLRQLALYLVLAVPFLIGIALVYWLLWRGRDLNGLMILKPPIFWWGAALAAAIVILYAAAALPFFLRRIYSVPILTFEAGAKVGPALRASLERSPGTMRRCAGAIAAWAVFQFLLAAVVMGLLHGALWFAVSRSGLSLATAVFFTGAALLVQAIVATQLGVLANVTLAGVLLSLYRRVAPAKVIAFEARAPAPAPRTRFGWAVGGLLSAAAALATGIGYMTIRDLKLIDNLEITAHRAGAASAPENTIAALNQAIADRADWAEIDVQLTADKALVVMHDIDLARVGGGNRRVDQATLAEIQALDVGILVGPAFASERIPTLGDFLAASGDKIRLNVELKPHGEADGPELTRRVIGELQNANLVERCRLCSQSYESLQLARRLEPRLPVGYIVATTIGDPAQLTVDFLMVKASLATRDLVDRARLRQIAVHAWTVNDPAQLAPLLDAGVVNIITDDPAKMRARLEEIRALNSTERLLLRARSALTP